MSVLINIADLFLQQSAINIEVMRISRYTVNAMDESPEKENALVHIQSLMERQAKLIGILETVMEGIKGEKDNR